MPGAARAQRTLRARRVEASGHTLRAEGDVRIGLGGCSLTANLLRLGRRRLVTEQACLRVPKALTLRAHRLALGGDWLSARWVRLQLCGCASASRLELSARRVELAPGGRRLHLTWPILRVGRVPVLAAPYWALPTGPGVSGLLAPRFGYSDRDGMRVEQPLYLAAGRHADLLATAGWQQQRGARLSGRARYFTEAHGDGRLEGLVVSDGAQWRGGALGALTLRGRQAAVGLWPDLVSDARVLADLADRAERVFAPYVRSRAALDLHGGPVSAALVTDLLRDMLPAAVRRDSYHTRVDGWLRLAPTRLFGPLSVDAAARLTRTDAAYSPAGAMRVLLLDLTPGLALEQGFGPLSLSARAGYRLQVLDLDDGAARMGHGATLAAELGLPLYRRFAGPVALSHQIEPFVGWRAALGDPRWIATAGSGAPRRAGHSLLGLRSSLTNAGGRRLARALVALALAPDRAHRLALELGLGRWRSLEGRAVLDLAGGAAPYVAGQACVGPAALRVCGGYLRTRLLRPADLLALDGLPLGEAAELDLALLSPALDQLRGELRTAVGPLSAGAQIAVDPVQRVATHGTFWADLTLGCGCYRIGLVGRTRRDQPLPDIGARLTLALGHRAGCLLP